MKRFAIFAVLGPALAAVLLWLVLLPLAGLLEGQRIEMSMSAQQVPSVVLICMFAGVVVALFDWITEIIEVPYRPIGAAIADGFWRWSFFAARWRCRICRDGLLQSVCWVAFRRLSARG